MARRLSGCHARLRGKSTLDPKFFTRNSTVLVAEAGPRVLNMNAPRRHASSTPRQWSLPPVKRDVGALGDEQRRLIVGVHAGKMSVRVEFSGTVILRLPARISRKSRLGPHFCRSRTLLTRVAPLFGAHQYRLLAGKRPCASANQRVHAVYAVRAPGLGVQPDLVLGHHQVKTRQNMSGKSRVSWHVASQLPR